MNDAFAIAARVPVAQMKMLREVVEAAIVNGSSFDDVRKMLAAASRPQ